MVVGAPVASRSAREQDALFAPSRRVVVCDRWIKGPSLLLIPLQSSGVSSATLFGVSLGWRHPHLSRSSRHRAARHHTVEGEAAGPALDRGGLTATQQGSRPAQVGLLAWRLIYKSRDAPSCTWLLACRSRLLPPPTRIRSFVPLARPSIAACPLRLSAVQLRSCHVEEAKGGGARGDQCPRAPLRPERHAPGCGAEQARLLPGAHQPAGPTVGCVLSSHHGSKLQQGNA